VKSDFPVDYSLVQILVVVAIIQVRTLKTEVRKGFVSTVFVYELVSPKKRENSLFQCSGGYLTPRFLKGKTVNIPLPDAVHRHASAGDFSVNLTNHSDINSE